MGKLKGKALQTIKDNVSSVRKSSDKNVYFHCTSNDGGVAVRDAIRTVFKPKDVTRYNYDLEAFIVPFGISHWRDFRAKFSTESEADECFNEVDAAVNSAYAEEIYDPVSGVDDENPDGTGVKTKAKSWTTYIVIGAAAIVILLLLWDRKKK